VRNPIDAFILARLEKAGLQPSPSAGKQQLIRRLSFDLTGLPPTPAEVEAFLADNSSDAYEKLVDRLLASPRYGEHWARFWLDLVRFAESDGFKADDFRPTAWRYRDYVIRALNEDRPYDQFLREQIAGDELYPDNPEAIVATGFNRHFPDEWNAKNLDLRRQEILDDVTDVTGQVVLGLTFGCARCHDHKFDPISQKDYYQLQAFFAAISPRNDLPLAEVPEWHDYTNRLHEWETKTAALRERMQTLEEPVRRSMVAGNKSKYQKAYQVAYDTPFAQRTPLQKQLADMLAKQLKVDPNQMAKRMQPTVRQEWDKLQEQMKGFAALKPHALPIVMGITDIGPEAPRTYLLQRGNYRKLSEEVQPGFPSRLDSMPAVIPHPAPGAKTTGRRAVLARWLSSAGNPLTARVMVNRLWQQHFGRGIAGTPSDLGAQGEPPTHPELLDWLAIEFMARGWSLKAMHRLMVTSSTYRQTSVRAPAGEKTDSGNRLWGRMTPRRLEGEMLRDAMLQVSGRLNAKMGGPSVLPELPRELGTPNGWKVTADREEHDRRSVYVFLKRNLRYPLFDVFDAPDSNESCARRNESTNAPQALALMNDDFTLEQARHIAGRALEKVSSACGLASGRARPRAAQTAGQGIVPLDQVVDEVYQRALGRAPDAKESAIAADFLRRETVLVRKRLQERSPTALPTPMPASLDTGEACAVVEFCHVVLNLNEFLYVD
jgi:hypothetical protein